MNKLFAFVVFFLISVNLLFAEGNPYTLSGDVRIKSCSNWQNKYEHALKCEATFGLDYNFPEAWVQTKFKISNPKETTEVSTVQLEIQQLLIGYNLFSGDNFSWDIELGRNKLDAMFESKLQYNNHFNGVNLVFNKQTNFGSVTLHGGPHIIRSEMDHFGTIAELGLSSIMGTNFSLKYSITDWLGTKNSSPEYAYLISQGLIKYQFDKSLGIYGAYLINHRSKDSSQGFYVGTTIGTLNKKGDYLADFNYQYLESCAVPNFDQSGIGKGFQLKLAYAFTDNFFLQGKIATTKTAELSAIYKW